MRPKLEELCEFMHSIMHDRRLPCGERPTNTSTNTNNLISQQSMTIIIWSTQDRPHKNATTMTSISHTKTNMYTQMKTEVGIYCDFPSRFDRF